MAAAWLAAVYDRYAAPLYGYCCRAVAFGLAVAVTFGVAVAFGLVLSVVHAVAVSVAAVVVQVALSGRVKDLIVGIRPVRRAWARPRLRGG